MKNIIELAYKLNAPDFTVFVEYSGHVEQLSLRVHVGGWKNTTHLSEETYPEYKKNRREYNYYIDPQNPELADKLACEWLNKIHDEYRGNNADTN